MKRAALAAVMSLVLSVSAFAGTPRPVEPVPEAAFRPVVVAPRPEGTQTRRLDVAPVLVDPAALQAPPTAQERVATVLPEVQPGSEPRGAPQTTIVGVVRLIGWSSWYCRRGRSPCHSSYPDRAGVVDLYAAAGPKLRAAICGVQSCTSWRGKTVYVNGTRVKLIDWCQCYWRRSNEKVIDLYWDAWVKTGGGKVSIGW